MSKVKQWNTTNSNNHFTYVLGYTLGYTIASIALLHHRELNSHIYLVCIVRLAFVIPGIHLQTQLTYPHLTMAYTNTVSGTLAYQEQFKSTILLSHLRYTIVTSSNVAYCKPINNHTTYPKLHNSISQVIRAY